MEVLVRSDRDPFERGNQWGSLLGAIEAGTLLSMETCFTVSHFLAKPPLAHCQCGHFEGSRQIYLWLSRHACSGTAAESSIVWSSFAITLRPLFVNRASVSQKSILQFCISQECLTRVFNPKSVSQKCGTKLSHHTVFQECLTHSRSHERVTSERLTRVE